MNFDFFLGAIDFPLFSQVLSPRFDRLDNSLISELYIKGFLKYASVLMMLEVSKYNLNI